MFYCCIALIHNNLYFLQKFIPDNHDIVYNSGIPPAIYNTFIPPTNIEYYGKFHEWHIWHIPRSPLLILFFKGFCQVIKLVSFSQGSYQELGAQQAIQTTYKSSSGSVHSSAVETSPSHFGDQHSQNFQMFEKSSAVIMMNISILLSFLNNYWKGEAEIM